MKMVWAIVAVICTFLPSLLASDNAVVECEGLYPHHLQGVCLDKDSIFWSFTTVLVKTDQQGKVLNKIPVANHHGDLCYQGGKVYVAVNLGKFNDSGGHADSWVYVYDSASLKELAKHPVPEVFHGAGGIAYRNDRFYVVGGLPEGVPKNYVYEYDSQFRFLKKHEIASGHTLMGIQTATFAEDQWWFGCYGSPKTLLVTDSQFQSPRRFTFDASLGIESLNEGRLIAALGDYQKEKGYSGQIRTVIPDQVTGLKILSESVFPQNR